MKIEVQQVGQLMTNCYIVWDENTKNAAVIDPGDDGAYLSDRLRKNGLTLQYILLTHGHFDHITGVPELLERFQQAGSCALDNDRILLSKVEAGN